MQGKCGMGWLRDLPDHRDLHVGSSEVQEIRGQSKKVQQIKNITPTTVDLRRWCSPIEDQGDLGSCTANAGVGVLEYFQRRAFGKHLDASRLFLYKVTRNLLGVTGDAGAELRTTMKAMVLFGVPPENYWPYKTESFDDEPQAFCYAFAQSYKTTKYFRLDPPGQDTVKTLMAVKKSLAAGLPPMFGFTVYSSMPVVGDATGDIPFPGPGDAMDGGHAVVAVGYDDSKKVGDDTGALIIRNSWGTDWGDQGYGWLPYSYVLRGLAVDFWTLVDSGFVDTELFDYPR
jgi:C1A family cysteine protease